MPTTPLQPPPTGSTAVGVAELRRYLLHPGTRGSFAALFEREFVDEHRARGISLGARYGDGARDDVFVWMRGFPSMAARRASLGAFYGGPCWQRWRDEANGMMIDSDDVLLLEPVDPARALPPVHAASAHGHIGIAPIGTTVAARSGLDAVRAIVEPVVGAPCHWWATSEHENDFPALPVRDLAAVVWYGEGAAEPSRLFPRLRAALAACDVVGIDRLELIELVDPAVGAPQAGSG